VVIHNIEESGGKIMNFMSRSAQVVCRILGAVVGDGFATPHDETARQHPYLAFYR